MPYCDVCGTEIDAAANYCPQCGASQTASVARTGWTGHPSLAGRTWVTALIGGIVGFILATIIAGIAFPFYIVGILGGGALGGYLHARGQWAGAKVGLLAGIVATAPVLLVIVLGAFVSLGGTAVGFFGYLAPGMGVAGIAALTLLTAVMFVLAIMANLLFGALGGFVGGALVEESLRLDDARHDR